jgi:uncharacterized membrane protein YjjP (DUF1212 family)
MIAPVLLLVPGVPAFNAQYDILEGRPTLGSARAPAAIRRMEEFSTKVRAITG